MLQTQGRQARRRQHFVDARGNIGHFAPPWSFGEHAKRAGTGCASGSMIN
jgi:hypothetical protein